MSAFPLREPVEGVEHCSSDAGSEDGSPRAMRLCASALRPSDTTVSSTVQALVGVRPAHWPVPHVCGMVPVELVAASPRAGLPLRCRLAASLAQHPRKLPT